MPRNKLAELRMDIARVERTIAETEAAPQRSKDTERALSALRYSLKVQRAQLAQLEKQLAKGS